MLSPTFGRSWKLKVASSLKQCVAPLEAVMAGHNVLAEYLGDRCQLVPASQLFF